MLSKTNLFSDQSHWHTINHIGRQTASLPRCLWRRKLGQHGPNKIHSMEDNPFGTLTLPLQLRKWLASKPRQRHHSAWWLASKLRPLAMKYQIYRTAELPHKSGSPWASKLIGFTHAASFDAKPGGLFTVASATATLKLKRPFWSSFLLFGPFS